MRFNGINPSDISSKVFVSHEVISVIPPRTVRMVTASRQSYLAGVDVAPREVKLHLNFAGRSIDNANELAARVAALFCRDQLAEYEPTHMPGKALSVVLQSASDPAWKWGFGVIEYTFVAPRPYFHSIAETILTGTSLIRMEPRGSVPCRPVISHTMAAASAALEIKKDNVTFMRIRNPLGTNLSQGTKVEVDLANRYVTVNNDPAMDYVDYTASDWHPNLLNAATISLTDAGNTTVRWRDEWL